MSFSVHCLGSGSSGNCMLVHAGDTRVLLDAGMSAREIQRRLALYATSLSQINAVVITHEHSDHCSGVQTLSRRHHIPIVSTAATLAALSVRYVLEDHEVLSAGASLALGDLCVESFSTSHDAADPVGYNFYHGGAKVSVVTDTGIARADILGRIEGADLLVVESNHDTDMLRDGPYPYFLKNRIRSRLGHLSNDDAAKLILANMRMRTQPPDIWLAHLSDCNNTPSLARAYVRGWLCEAGCSDVTLDVALRDEPSLTWDSDGSNRALQGRLF